MAPRVSVGVVDVTRIELSALRLQRIQRLALVDGDPVPAHHEEITGVPNAASSTTCVDNRDLNSERQVEIEQDVGVVFAVVDERKLDETGGGLNDPTTASPDTR